MIWILPVLSQTSMRYWKPHIADNHEFVAVKVFLCEISFSPYFSLNILPFKNDRSILHDSEFIEIHIITKCCVMFSIYSVVS